MGPETAEAWADHVKMRLGGVCDGQIRTYAVPCSKGYLRRSVSWSILIVTDMPEMHVRDALVEHQIEFLTRESEGLVFIAWPRTQADGLNGSSTLEAYHGQDHATPHPRG